MNLLHAGTFGTKCFLNGKVFGLWDGAEEGGDAGKEQVRRSGKYS